ncbi:hypothetical protein DL89DRAFT_185690 [Linderina pennispora]|uniref:Uncharacterized protein n=1 Tax=Linderina pennispora TaxID=61395 RepID=A0A1Y1VT37_9FUNG|nr:uncharacterized protein DL89DRAFT_185690 [Linderina pennispora]ORX64459.1 hypothetical protein DL89DRAFT_185690 [Linderina pennispora]
MAERETETLEAQKSKAFPLLTRLAPRTRAISPFEYKYSHAARGLCFFPQALCISFIFISPFSRFHRLFPALVPVQYTCYALIPPNHPPSNIMSPFVTFGQDRDVNTCDPRGGISIEEAREYSIYV